MQATYDNDQFTGLIVDRLAWHTERWMKAAFELGKHERALILATHAGALEGHATRLNLRTDFIAYLRGNLASIQYRQNKIAQVAQLLRSEIDHYRGRDDEPAQLLVCQASMHLAVVQAEDDTGPVDEIPSLLETAYFTVLRFIPRNPEGMAFLVANIRTILNSLELKGVRHERLSMLAVAVEDLAGRLPATPLSIAIRTCQTRSSHACMSIVTAGPANWRRICCPRNCWLMISRQKHSTPLRDAEIAHRGSRSTT